MVIHIPNQFVHVIIGGGYIVMNSNTPTWWPTFVMYILHYPTWVGQQLNLDLVSRIGRSSSCRTWWAVQGRHWNNVNFVVWLYR